VQLAPNELFRMNVHTAGHNTPQDTVPVTRSPLSSYRQTFTVPGMHPSDSTTTTTTTTTTAIWRRVRAASTE